MLPVFLGKRPRPLRYAEEISPEHHARDYIEVDEAHAIFEVEVPEGWIGKTVGELDIRRKYSINIMATKENGKINMAVSPETVLTNKTTLLVLGAYKELQKCFRI